MKKALVHDWYYVSGGAEKVVHSLNNIWNDLDHFALVDFLNDYDRDFILKGKSVRTSLIQNLPTAKSNHRKFLPLFPFAIEQLDLREYKLVLSSSASVAKGVLTNQDQLHICYCHSPMRYAWDLYFDYLEHSNLKKGLKANIAKYFLHKIRIWDYLNSQRVDHFIANSNFVSNRIRKTYRRESTVIYPPVNVEEYTLTNNKSDFYVTASRMVPYKKIDLIVEAFNQMPNKRLVVIGDGPDFLKIKKNAKANIDFKGFLPKAELRSYFENAKAFVFAAEEDFGIVPVEAQACGTPVIAFGKGGSKETIIHEQTGILFNEQTSKSIKDAVEYFEHCHFSLEKIRMNAERFSKKRFEKEIFEFVQEKSNAFFK
jgi:glycosyltransferase involved in cell wall biosynthesis